MLDAKNNLLRNGNLLETNFSTLDAIIVVVYLLATVGIGLYVNRFIHGMGDFLVAGRSLRTCLGVATMVGSELGLVTAMYSAQKGFTGGLAAFHIGLLAGLACLVVGLTGLIVVPLREQRITTIPEYYQRRFGSRRLRIIGGLLLALSGILNMGLFLKAGAVFVTGLTGMNDPVMLNVVMTVMILLVLAYTALGGMVSVIITDYAQFVVLSFGLLLTCLMAYSNLGWTAIVEAVTQVHGAAGIDPLNESGFGGSYVTWMFFLGIISCAVWQTAVMRACAAESVQVVRRLYLWSSLGFMIRFLIPQFIGVCALTYFWQNGNSYFFEDGKIVAEHSMEAMPVFLSQLLPAGLIGIVGAGMLAAFMSTHDTYLLCWASVLTEDVVNPIMGDRMTQRGRLTLTRVFLCMIAAFLLIWSMWYELRQDLWDYMAVSGAIYFIGAFAILAAGIYWKRASTVGAWLAMLCGGGAILGLAPIQRAVGVFDWFARHQVTSAQVGLAMTGAAIAGMILGSLIFPDSQQPLNEETL